MIDAPGANEEDNASASDNAVSALGKLCRRADPVGQQFFPRWLSALPLQVGVVVLVVAAAAAVAVVSTTHLGVLSRHFISAFISAFYLGVSSPQADRAEARVVHTALIDLVKSTNAAMLGPSHERLPDVIVVFGQLLTTPDLCDDGVPAQIVQLLKQVGSRWDRGSTRACCRD